VYSVWLPVGTLVSTPAYALRASSVFGGGRWTGVVLALALPHCVSLAAACVGTDGRGHIRARLLHCGVIGLDSGAELIPQRGGSGSSELPLGPSALLRSTGVQSSGAGTSARTKAPTGIRLAKMRSGGALDDDDVLLGGIPWKDVRSAISARVESAVGW
jgi:hypothetical protein